MSDTTGNQDLAIATNGTSHVAMTMGPTDVCKLPNNVPSPFPNFIAIKGNLKDGTTNTFVANEPVWIQRSYLGPTSDPAHPGVNKGVASGTYRGIARATSWSKDVQKEGQYVVRTNDSTTQNNANTSGTVMGSPLTGSVEAQDQYKQLVCTITRLEGTCSHGRDLGPPPGAKKDDEPNYLEVLGEDTVKFTSTREDLVTKTIDPGCVKGIHTHWNATRTGGLGGTAETKTEQKDSLKIYELGPSLTGDPNQESDAATARKGLQAPGGIKVKGIPNQDKAEKIVSNIMQAAVLWDAIAHPVIIAVEATACSGKKAATIKVLPKGEFTFDLFDDSVKAGVEWLKKLLNLVERVGSFFGQPVTIKFLEKPKLKFIIQYKELTADKPAKAMPYNLGTLGPYYKVQARRSWSLDFGFDPLIGGSAKFTVPIATAIPAVGSAVATVLKWVGAEGNVFIQIELNFAPHGIVKWDEYDVVSCDVSAQLTIMFSVGVEVKVVCVELSVQGYIDGKVTFDNWGPRPGLLLACDMKGELQLGAKGSAKATFWGISYSKEFDYKPDCLKWGNKDPVVIPIRKKPASGGASSP
ncbi:MAG: DUF4150 domain-containing protein [Minicystis sp.]